jgi:hypothetical protein
MQYLQSIVYSAFNIAHQLSFYVAQYIYISSLLPDVTSRSMRRIRDVQSAASRWQSCATWLQAVVQPPITHFLFGRVRVGAACVINAGNQELLVLAAALLAAHLSAHTEGAAGRATVLQQYPPIGILQYILYTSPINISLQIYFSPSSRRPGGGISASDIWGKICKGEER